MTYLAVSTNSGDPSALIGAEAARMDELVQSGVVTRFWLKEDWSGAVLVLSSEREEDARQAVGSLPITRAGLNAYALTALVEPPTAPVG